MFGTIQGRSGWGGEGEARSKQMRVGGAWSAQRRQDWGQPSRPLALGPVRSALSPPFVLLSFCASPYSLTPLTASS